MLRGARVGAVLHVPQPALTQQGITAVVEAMLRVVSLELLGMRL